MNLCVRGDRLCRAFCAVLVVRGICAWARRRARFPPGRAQNLQQLGRACILYSPSAIHSSASVAPEGLAEMKLVPGSSVKPACLTRARLEGRILWTTPANISIPLAGSIHLESLTLREAESAVNAKLVCRRKSLRIRMLSLNIDEYSAKSVTVSGEVTSPGRYPELLSHPHGRRARKGRRGTPNGGQ